MSRYDSTVWAYARSTIKFIIVLFQTQAEWNLKQVILIIKKKTTPGSNTTTRGPVRGLAVRFDRPMELVCACLISFQHPVRLEVDLIGGGGG